MEQLIGAGISLKVCWWVLSFEESGFYETFAGCSLGYVSCAECWLVFRSLFMLVVSNFYLGSIFQFIFQLHLSKSSLILQFRPFPFLDSIMTNITFNSSSSQKCVFYQHDCNIYQAGSCFNVTTGKVEIILKLT